MKGPDRRLAPRKTVERFAYINIEASNGGSVLNVCENGLCFQSIAPVQRTETIRFWFREHHHRIEVQGQLVWMDETQKTAGLRFMDLPEEAREAIREWICFLTTPVASDQAFPFSTLLRQATPPLGTRRPDTKVAPDSSEHTVASRKVKAQALLPGFSGGLATGLLISALVTVPFLFRSYKRQLGESLIQWGERFAARPHSQMQSLSPAPQAQAVVLAPQAESPAPQKMAAASRMLLPAARSIPMLRSEKLLPEHVKKTAEPEPTQIAHETTTPATSTPTATIAPKASAAVAAAAVSTTASTTRLPAAPVASGSSVIAAKPGPLPPLKPAIRDYNQNASAENAGSSSRLYFEVGKFKDGLLAYRTTDNLARLGLHATIVEKGHFWTNSYHVLVGPYDDDKAEGIRQKLISSGFKPQVFERGSRNLTIYGGCDTMSRLLRSERKPRGVQLPLRVCVISWETYSTHAMVTFVQENNIIAKADGKWVKRAIRYQRDVFVYRKNDDGSETLMEIQFAGMSHALLFDKS
jgi:PilZ domain-containing protein